MTLSYTYTPLSPNFITRVRVRTGDTRVSNEGKDALFSDEEINMFMKDESDVSGETGRNLVLLVSAHMYEVMAANIALYVGKQSFLNNFTDGPAAAKVLMETADNWRSQVMSVI